MKRALTSLLLLLSATGFAQDSSNHDFAPENAKWVYGWYHIWGPSQGYYTYTVTGDTTINGHQASRIKRQGPTVDFDVWNTVYTYTDSNRVYWANDSTLDFTVLYDFNLVAGDTMNVAAGSHTVRVIIDSIVEVTINGQQLKRQYITATEPTNNNQPVWWGPYFTERLGGSGALYPMVATYIDGTLYGKGLRCYTDSILGNHNTGLESDCYYVVTGMKEVEIANVLKCFPNPVHTDVYLEPLGNNAGESWAAEVYALSGQLVYRTSFTGRKTLDVRGWAPGMYYLQLRSAGGLTTSTRLVKE